MPGLVGQGVGAQVIGLGRLAEPGHRADGVVQQRDHVRERVPEEPGDAQRDVDPGAAEFGQREDLEAGDPARGVVPARAAADEREHLGDVVALRAHGRGAPHGQAHAARILPLVREMPGDQRVREGQAGLEGRA